MQEELGKDVIDNIKPFSSILPDAGQEMISQGKVMQRVQTQHTTAISVQQPRSIAKVHSNVMAEAKLAGASFFYRWVVKSRGREVAVQGPSIGLAMCVARNFGNCVVDMECEETPGYYLFKGYFIDLETGFTISRMYRQRKAQDMGMKDVDRAEDIAFQIGQSKCARNVVVKGIPEWMLDEAVEVARSAEINKIKPDNLELAKSKVLEFFARYAITPERIEAKIGVKVATWDAEIIADLRSNAQQLRDGQMAPLELFPEIDQSAEAQEPSKKPAPKKAPDKQETIDKLEAGDHDLGTQEKDTGTQKSKPWGVEEGLDFIQLGDWRLPLRKYDSADEAHAGEEEQGTAQIASLWFENFFSPSELRMNQFEAADGVAKVLTTPGERGLYKNHAGEWQEEPVYGYWLRRLKVADDTQEPKTKKTPGAKYPKNLKSPWVAFRKSWIRIRTTEGWAKFMKDPSHVEVVAAARESQPELYSEIKGKYLESFDHWPFEKPEEPDQEGPETDDQSDTGVDTGETEAGPPTGAEDAKGDGLDAEGIALMEAKTALILLRSEHPKIFLEVCRAREPEITSLDQVDDYILRIKEAVKLEDHESGSPGTW